jgi:hypothetical protein
VSFLGEKLLGKNEIESYSKRRDGSGLATGYVPENFRSPGIYIISGRVVGDKK